MESPVAIEAAYRPLEAAEVAALEAAGCTAEDWGRVRVHPQFTPEHVRNASFSGDVRLGRFRRAHVLPGGVPCPAGVRDAALHDCTVGDDALVRNVRRHVARYEIGPGAVIDGVELLAVDGQTAFGNGTRVAAVNEAGGRRVPIYDRLSGQIAWLLVFCRHRPDALAQLEGMISAYVDTVSAERGQVGAGASIVNSGALTNLRVGPAARIRGALRLADGTINSCSEAPAEIGAGVIAEHFILSSGSTLDSGAVVTRSFIGQGVRAGRHFSAEHSLLFANCEAQHGEACSAFAGPFTVTHHRATLLIAGYYSFFNAGSGTNHSNHLYKLGPLHQGVLRRGCKTGSDAYLVWPSCLGAFTTVTGRHRRGFDSSDFPFSIVLESAGGSLLLPGANFCSVGVLRDTVKWQSRDRRADPDKLDLLHLEPLSPYTIGPLLRGRRQLAAWLAAAAADDLPGGQPYYEYGGLRVPGTRLRKAKSAYDTAVDCYLGAHVARRLEQIVPKTPQAGWLPALLAAGGTQAETTGAADDAWVDLAGLLAPRREVERLLEDLEQRRIGDLPLLETRLLQMHGAFAEHDWRWARHAWLAEMGKPADQVTLADVAETLSRWQQAAVQRHRGALRDAEREFQPSARLGYGLDGPAEAAAADFAAVRGAFADHPFVAHLQQEIERVAQRAERLRALLPGGSGQNAATLTGEIQGDSPPHRGQSCDSG